MHPLTPTQALTPSRAHRLGPLAAALLGVVLLAVACSRTAAILAPAGGSPGPGLASLPVGVGCTAPTPSPPSAPGYGLVGPAVTSLTGGAVTAAFSLDSGGLSVQPPAGSDQPSVGAGTAECDALASLDADGTSFSLLAGRGLAIGYGRVTISASLVAGAISSPPNTSCSDCDNPILPAATPYRDRLAWVVAVSDPAMASCPMEPPGTPRPSPDILPGDHNYELFLLDATTGSGALDYLESQVAPCNPSTRIPPQVELPREQVSVPWTLGARDPGGYSATITAQVLPCDGYQPTLNVDENQPSAEVVVERPVAAACGPEHSVSLTLRAATVTSNLPATIGHDPTGLFTDTPGSGPVATPSSVPSPSATPPLRMLGLDDNQTTITVPVGAVLVTPFGLGTRPGVPVDATSSDTAVLGPLGSPVPIGPEEFRAWEPGTAVFTMPDAGCPSSTAASPCTAPFTVHVVVQ